MAADLHAQVAYQIILRPTSPSVIKALLAAPITNSLYHRLVTVSTQSMAAHCGSKVLEHFVLKAFVISMDFFFKN